MAVPKNINREAIELLEHNGWRWSDYHFSFRRVVARSGDYLDRPPELITFEELEDNGLGTPPGKEPEAFARGLEWLKSKLGSNGSVTQDI